MAQLITPLSFQGQIQPLDEGKRGVRGEYVLMLSVVIFYVNSTFSPLTFSLSNNDAKQR
jgi:hypothetical protein